MPISVLCCAFICAEIDTLTSSSVELGPGSRKSQTGSYVTILSFIFVTIIVWLTELLLALICKLLPNRYQNAKFVQVIHLHELGILVMADFVSFFHPT